MQGVGSRWFTVRYLWVVFPHVTSSAVVCGLLAGFGVWTLSLRPTDAGPAYLPLLVFQLFAASSGFRRVADGGHLDALLVSGVTRVELALWHWGLTALPLAIAWLLVATVELGMAMPSPGVGFGAPGLTALFIVSAIAWAASVATTRLFGGVAWTFLLAFVATSPAGRDMLQRAVVPPDTWTAADVLQSALAFIVCPFLLLVPAVTARASVAVLVTVIAVAGAALAGGIGWIAWKDYPITR